MILSMIRLLSFILLTCLLISMSTIGFGQVRADRLKAHVNYNKTNDGHNVGRLAPAIVLKGEKRFEHELELNSIEKSKEMQTHYFASRPGFSADFMVRNYALALRYQFSAYLTNKEDAKWLPQVGVSILPAVQHTINETDDPGVIDRSNTNFDVALSIVPQLRRQLSKRAFLDIAIPITPLSFEYRYQRIKNPSIPVRQQRNDDTELASSSAKDMVENLHIRLGIGLKL